MKIELLLKIQKILDLLLSMITEFENAKADVENDCYLIRKKFDTDDFKNIIQSFFTLQPSKKNVIELQEKVLCELNCSCIHQFVEDDIECNMDDMHINYCILCGINKDL
uniref:Uncharacterized protein n=1 Tax=viral metagenome TaxID=1070528 RepID=A0A6C0HRX2_9ZZZZ